MGKIYSKNPDNISTGSTSKYQSENIYKILFVPAHPPRNPYITHALIKDEGYDSNAKNNEIDDNKCKSYLVWLSW